MRWTIGGEAAVDNVALFCSTIQAFTCESRVPRDTDEPRLRMNEWKVFTSNLSPVTQWHTNNNDYNNNYLTFVFNSAMAMEVICTWPQRLWTSVQFIYQVSIYLHYIETCNVNIHNYKGLLLHMYAIKVHYVKYVFCIMCYTNELHTFVWHMCVVHLCSTSV